MFEVLFVLLLLGALVLLLGPRFFKRGPRNAEDTGHGQLLITGLSPRPDGVTGEQYVTISGVITRQNAVWASLTAVSVVMLIGAWLFG